MKIWALAVPDERAEQQQTANFILIGNVSTARLTEIGKLAEAERAKIVKLLKLPPDAPLVKGSLVLFVLKRSFDYSEFVRMVEERELPRGLSGHARRKGADAYACLVVGTDRDAALTALVAEQVAAGFLASLSDVPAWFAAGGGRAIAARVEPKNPLVKQWDAELLPNTSTTPTSDAFLSASVLDTSATTNSYSFVRALAVKLDRFQAAGRGPWRRAQIRPRHRRDLPRRPPHARGSLVKAEAQRTRLTAPAPARRVSETASPLGRPPASAAHFSAARAAATTQSRATGS